MDRIMCVLACPVYMWPTVPCSGTLSCSFEWKSEIYVWKRTRVRNDKSEFVILTYRKENAAYVNVCHAEHFSLDRSFYVYLLNIPGYFNCISNINWSGLNCIQFCMGIPENTIRDGTRFKIVFVYWKICINKLNSESIEHWIQKVKESSGFNLRGMRYRRLLSCRWYMKIKSFKFMPSSVEINITIKVKCRKKAKTKQTHIECLMFSGCK